METEDQGRDLVDDGLVMLFGIAAIIAIPLWGPLWALGWIARKTGAVR